MNIATNLVQQLRAESAAAEQLKQLTPQQLATIIDHNWFNLFVPKSQGGLELSFYDALLIEEQLAFIDGSLGWTVTLCAGANYFSGFLSPELNESLFKNPKVCLGGSGKVGGKAIPKNDKLIIDGEWTFSTGAPHLTAFTANCHLHDSSGNPLFLADGQPKIISIILPPDAVEVIHDWNTMGLIATASHGFKVRNNALPLNHTFLYNQFYTPPSYLIYQIPFLTFAACTLAVNYWGMAWHFMDLAEAKLHTKQAFLSKDVYTQFNEVRKKLAELRSQLYDQVILLEGKLCPDFIIDTMDESRIQHICKEIYRTTLQAASSFYPYCGIEAASFDSTINRVYRDIFTASQHTFFQRM